jgi:hypothetical protein
MLHRLTCFIVVFSLLTPVSVHCSEEDDIPRVAIIGGGYTGILSGILLARLRNERGDLAFKVDLFEKDLVLMNGASSLCARLHLGGEYPLHKDTAQHCLFSALLYRRMFPTEAILTNRRRNDFLVAKESTANGDLTLEQVHQHYSFLKDLYRTTFDQFSSSLGDGEEAARQLFGNPDEFFEFLASSEDIEDERLRSHFAGGVSTGERGFQSCALGVILERLLEQSNVQVHLGCSVTGAEYMRDQRYKLRTLSNNRVTQEFCINYVISAAWHDNPYLTAIASSSLGAVHRHSPAKVFLRSIGLFDVSSCVIPQDRSYFGLMGYYGGMVSFYSSSVAAIYIPDEGFSLQGETTVTYDHMGNTFLSEGEQNRLYILNNSPEKQNEVLHRILVDAEGKYPFLKEAKPIKLLTRTTVSMDSDVVQRSHAKPSWRLDTKGWLVAESTKATFAPLTALQVFSEIVSQPEIQGRVHIDKNTRDFLETIQRPDYISFAKELIEKFPEEYVLYRDTLTDRLDLAQMQLYALKRKLPFAIIEGFSRRGMITIRSDFQIPMIDWEVLDNVDLRSVAATQNFLNSLADAIQTLPPTKGFKIFRLKYSNEESQFSRVLRALEKRLITELEIDQLHLSMDEDAKSLVDLLINSSLQKLILTGFSTRLPDETLRNVFLLSLDRAKFLKSVKLLFKNGISYREARAFLNSLQDAPELEELIFSHNQFGEILSSSFEAKTLLIQFMERSKKLKDFDLSGNRLFADERAQLAESFMNKVRRIEASRDLRVCMDGNELDRLQMRGFRFRDLHQSLEETQEQALSNDEIRYMLYANIPDLRERRGNLLSNMWQLGSSVVEASVIGFNTGVATVPTDGEGFLSPIKGFFTKSIRGVIGSVQGGMVGGIAERKSTW